jgi:hypothetical protein
MRTKIKKSNRKKTNLHFLGGEKKNKKKKRNDTY